MLDRKRIGKELKALRVKQGLDQIDVARRAQISPGTLQTIEWGARENKDANIDKVARALGTTLARLAMDPTVDPTDPLLVGLNREDLEIARAYHDASTAVRSLARQTLRDRDPLPRTPGEATAESTALAARIARLAPDVQALLDQIMTLLDDDDGRQRDRDVS